MRIGMIERQEANEQIGAIYDRFDASGLGVYNVMKLWANDPAFLQAFECMINALYGDDTLEARYRELAWLRTSQINSCHY
ncbi:MAG: carboxymuconolactone decarboxylase family protein [Pseudomonadota bacterium]